MANGFESKQPGRHGFPTFNEMWGRFRAGTGKAKQSYTGKVYGQKGVAPQGYLWHIDIVHFAVGRQFCD